MSADARRIYHRAGSAVGRVGEDTARDERVAQLAAAADVRFECVVREVYDVGAQECGGAQSAHLARGQDARKVRALGRVGDIRLRGGAVVQCAQQKFCVHLRRCTHRRVECRWADAVGVAFGVGVGRVGQRPVGHIGKGLVGRAGQRLALLAEKTNEHNERLHARGGLLEVKALAVARVRPAEERESFERGGHGRIVDRGRACDGIEAAVIHDRGLAGGGEKRRRVLGDEIAVIFRERRAAFDLAAGRHVDDRAGGKLHIDAARQHDDLKTGRAGENVALLEARLGEDVGALRAHVGLCRGNGRAERGLSLCIRRLIGLVEGGVDGRSRLGGKRCLQIVERDQRVAAVSPCGHGRGGEHRHCEERCEQGNGPFHGLAPSSSASAEVLEMR